MIVKNKSLLCRFKPPALRTKNALLVCVFAFSASIDVSASDAGRTLTRGDMLAITVEESPDLNGQYGVLGDGTIDLKFAGRVLIEGKNLAEAAQAIENSLKTSYFKNASVSVTISDAVQGNITLLGAVNNPGIIPFGGEQLMTVMELILNSGGLSGQAAADQVKIFRRKPGGSREREVINIDMNKILNEYEFNGDEYLRPHDIVVVPEMGSSPDDPPSEFLILGEFSRPGFYPAMANLNMIRAITMAGGISREAQLETARVLRPGTDGSYTVIPVDLARLFGSADMSMNIAIYPGDILFLPSASQASGGVVYFLGALSNPGIYPLPFTGSATLARTMLQRGGWGKFSNQEAVKVLRKDPDGSRRTLVFDVEAILKTGNFDNDIPLQAEDVIIVSEKLLNLF